MLLQYFIPGFLSLKLGLFLTSKKISIKITAIFSLVISYTLMCIISTIRLISLFKNIPNIIMINSCFSILLGVIFSVLFAILFQVKYVKAFMVKHFHKTFNDDIWQDVFDLKDGCNLKAFLKDKDYYIIGHLKSYEEKGKDSWIALSGFSMYSKKDNTSCKNHPDYSKNSSIIITFRFSDIDYIEIF